MKITLLVLLTFTVLQTFGQPTVYFDFVSHNEETPTWNNSPYYTSNRTRLITLSDYFQLHGVTWNLQSDWVYLTNVLTQETPTLLATTDNKNILRWLYEDKDVEMDPHAHESQYLYPDVVKLMDSVGLPESKLMGGTIYNDNNGVNIWTNLVDGQFGAVFPNKFWRPDYMMGGGTPNHVADLKYYGFWNPQSPTAYLTHDSTSHLRHIGVGCSIKIKDTSNVANIVAEIKTVVQNVQGGLYPSNGFYLQTIFFEQGDLNDIMFYNKVITVADSVNALVASGLAEWKTLKQAYTIWENDYNAEVFQWECGQIISGVQAIYDSKFLIRPNPAGDKIEVAVTDDFSGSGFRIYDVQGKVLYEATINSLNKEVDVSFLPSGIYFCRLRNSRLSSSASKLVVQR